MLMLRTAVGFTVVELVITMAVLSTLTVLSLPTFTGALNNSKVRSATEALQNGLRNAQGEAVRRSRQTAFVLTNSPPAADATPVANGKYWYIQILPIVPTETIADEFVQGGRFGEQTAGVGITGPAIICFNSMGRVVTNASPGNFTTGCTAPSPMATYDVTIVGADRTLQLQVSAAGKIRMCDKSRSLSATAPDGCT